MSRKGQANMLFGRGNSLSEDQVPQRESPRVLWAETAVFVTLHRVRTSVQAAAAAAGSAFPLVAHQSHRFF